MPEEWIADKTLLTTHAVLSSHRMQFYRGKRLLTVATRTDRSGLSLRCGWSEMGGPRGRDCWRDWVR